MDHSGGRRGDRVVVFFLDPSCDDRSPSLQYVHALDIISYCIRTNVGLLEGISAVSEHFTAVPGLKDFRPEILSVISLHSTIHNNIHPPKIKVLTPSGNSTADVATRVLAVSAERLRTLAVYLYEDCNKDMVPAQGFCLTERGVNGHQLPTETC